MSKLLSSSHLIIGKAGGASVQEAMASACPMIIDSMIPGQEEGNAEMITKMGAGIIAFEPKEICLLYTSPSPRDKRQSRMPSSA